MMLSIPELIIPVTKKSAASNPDAARSLNPGGSRPLLSPLHEVNNLFQDLTSRLIASTFCLAAWHEA